MSIKIDIVSNLYAMYIYILNKNTPAMHIFEYSISPPGFFGVFQKARYGSYWLPVTKSWVNNIIKMVDINLLAGFVPVKMSLFDSVCDVPCH